MATRQRIRKIVPFKGRRSGWPSTINMEDASPNAQNIRFKFGEARPNFGRRPWGNTSNVETVSKLHVFTTIDNNEWSLKFQDTLIYRWGNAVPGTPKDWTALTGAVIAGGSGWSLTAGEGQLFAAKGVDGIYKWDGLPATVVTKVTASDSGTVPIPRFVLYFANHLVTAYNNEGGNTYANRVRWAQSGDYTKWNEANRLGAGFIDIFDGEQEPITGFERLRDRIIVYRPHSIGELVPTFDVNTVFSYQTRITGIGTVYPHTIANNGDVHFFLGTDGYVYAYDGTSLRKISENIFEEVVSVLSMDEAIHYLGEIVFSQQEYWLIINNTTAGRNPGYFIFDYQRNYWTRDTFPSLTSIGELVDTSTTDTWLTVHGIWTDDNRSWDDASGKTSGIIVAGRSDGKTFLLDENVGYDYFTIGSIVDRFFETEDFLIGGDGTFFSQGTVFRALLEYRYVDATPFEFGYSIDRGQNWTTTLVTPQVKGLSFVDFIATGPTIRFRFRENNNDGSFRWRTYCFDFEPSGDWIGTN